MAQDGGTAVTFVEPALGIGRARDEYDASSGTNEVTRAAGSRVSGIVTATLTPFGSTPGSLSVGGRWSCTLSG